MSNSPDACTVACTSKTTIEHGICLKAASDDGFTPAAGQPAGDFAAALMMIATLPLSGSEKAEAVRRLLDRTS
jgi:hypothetical protein